MYPMDLSLSLTRGLVGANGGAISTLHSPSFSSTSLYILPLILITTSTTQSS